LQPAAGGSVFQLGIDRILREEEWRDRLRGSRVALLGHPASHTRDFRPSLDALMEVPQLRITAAFGPQHGMRGEKQDNMVESPDYADPVYGIPVFSLYGEVRRPTGAMMNTFDVLLVDLQDVGTRIYTFLTTLLYVMEAGAKYKKPIWILDRPNPAGRPVEGSLLRPGWESFVGAGAFPMRHGLTMGEAARWFKKKHNMDVELEVIPMTGYQPEAGPGFGWPLGELSWINPSPNAANLSMARCFPGTVLIEGTHLSEGRGTTRPLETMGAPDLDSTKLLREMERLAPQWMKGASLRPCYFLPTFQKHAGSMCAGIQIHVDHRAYNHQEFRPYRLVALWLKAIRNLHPDYKIWRDFHYEYEKTRLAFDLINGGPFLREWVDDQAARPADLDAYCVPDEKKWDDERREFLLY
jgi:uncharacterized protein YbbC (DUF1343 family)